MTQMPDISTMSFEEAMSTLENVVRRLESGLIKLDEAVETYEYGVKLKQHCEQKLNAAKAKIDLLVIDKKNVIGVEDFNADTNA